ncbi:MAG: shikimate kinase [Terriglobales bacterium]
MVRAFASRSAMGVRAVFLVGFMGSGKSSVGKELARRLGWEFVDLDARIESRKGRTIPEIFRAHGEPGFRLVETAALCELTESLERESVVALGGGAFVPAENRALLRHWPAVFLEAPVDELWRRSAEQEGVRPLRTDREQFAGLYAKRLPYYRQATVVVNTAGKDLASICAEIEGALQLVTVKAGSSLDLPPSSETGGSR